MSLVAVLPVKRFSSAKERLADDGLSAAERVALATGMLSDVLAALRRCDHVDDIVVVTGEPGAESLARGAGAQVLADSPQDDHSAAAMRGIEWAIDAALETIPGARVIVTTEVDGDRPVVRCWRRGPGPRGGRRACVRAHG